MTSRLGTHLNLHSSFLSIFRSQEFTWTVSQSFLNSPTFHVINPRNHCAKGDKVSIKLSASAVSGLKDEAILALLTKGFFGGWVFAMEGWTMRAFGGVLPARYEAFKDKPTKKIIWKNSDIPKDKLVPTGDMFFDFALVNKHIQTSSDSSPSFVDYGFGSDRRIFAGSQRFAVSRKVRVPDQDVNGKVEQAVKEEEYVELYVECFRCNPVVDRDSWAEYAPWLHYWYARFLWAEAVRAVLRR